MEGYHTHTCDAILLLHPQGKDRLLSPQHWAQTSGEKPPHIGETTTAYSTVLSWNKGESKRTIPISNSIQDSNAATFRLSSRYKEYHTYHAVVGYRESPMREPNPLTIHDTRLFYIMDDSGDDIPMQEDPTSGWSDS